MKTLTSIALLATVSLSTSQAADFPQDLLELFKQRGVSMAELQSGTITRMSSDARYSEIKDSQCTINSSAETCPSSNDQIISNFGGNIIFHPNIETINRMVTQEELAKQYTSGRIYNTIVFKNVVLENVQFDDKGVILSGKVISGSVQQNGILYPEGTIFPQA